MPVLYILGHPNLCHYYACRCPGTWQFEAISRHKTDWKLYFFQFLWLTLTLNPYLWLISWKMATESHRKYYTKRVRHPTSYSRIYKYIYIIGIQTFPFIEMHLKMSSANTSRSCPVVTVLFGAPTSSFGISFIANSSLFILPCEATWGHRSGSHWIRLWLVA